MHWCSHFWDNQLQITVQRTGDIESRSSTGELPNPSIRGITHLYTSTPSPHMRFWVMLVKASLKEMFLTPMNWNLSWSSENAYSPLTTNIVQYRICHPLFLLGASRYNCLGFFNQFFIILGIPGERTKPCVYQPYIYHWALSPLLELNLYVV